jgi:hypothetical protein
LVAAMIAVLGIVATLGCGGGELIAAFISGVSSLAR